MATWTEVERVGLTLPETSVGEADEGSPAVFVRTRHSPYVVMAALRRVGTDLLRELLVESWASRAPARLRAAHPDLM